MIFDLPVAPQRHFPLSVRCAYPWPHNVFFAPIVAQHPHLAPCSPIASLCQRAIPLSAQRDDPSLPLPNSPLESQVIRDQLQALFNLINDIVTVTAAQVDSTNTLPPSSPANASVTVSGNTLHFTFEIPQG